MCESKIDFAIIAIVLLWSTSVRIRNSLCSRELAGEASNGTAWSQDKFYITGLKLAGFIIDILWTEKEDGIAKRPTWNVSLVLGNISKEFSRQPFWMARKIFYEDRLLWRNRFLLRCNCYNNLIRCTPFLSSNICEYDNIRAKYCCLHEVEEADTTLPSHNFKINQMHDTKRVFFLFCLIRTLT